MTNNNHAIKDYFPSYKVDTAVFDREPTRIYRAHRCSDNEAVILKTIGHERATTESAAVLKHEYEVAARLNAPGVIRVFSLEQVNNLPLIELEDFGGDSLDNIIRQQALTIEEVLKIGIQVARGLDSIHKANIIHKDINPSNIVYNASTGTAKIIDFGISTCFSREQVTLSNPKTLEGTLPYISPEQTGRINRAMDYRSDFYAFGVTLYELLTRQPLFIVKDPFEWIHYHIAKQPVPPVRINAAIPGQLSDIVMKLLSKTPEDRYQSARGIVSDLSHCLTALAEKGTVTPFPLAQADISERFHIPQRLYGREKEVGRLMAGFDQARQGQCRMILVSGYSGIGKTSLIREIYKPVIEMKGHFVSGKFDQLNRNIPYSALTSALQDLVNQLLTEPEGSLDVWRKNIQKALGANAGLMVEIIPDLELIIGRQPDTPDVPALEAEQRFHMTFQNFVQVFCSAGHPLVLFLDDLQWADRASMTLMDILTGEDAVNTHLLLIGAYRDNELTPSHPVTLWIKELSSNNIPYDDIHLNPLSAAHLSELIKDTLSVDDQRATPLAEITEKKTGGNPFFTEEFLKNIYHEGLITFSHEKQGWTWDLRKIQDCRITENVVDLMSDNIKKLPPETLQLIELGACIGFRFSLKDLSTVSEKSPADVARHLRPAILENLITPSGEVHQLLRSEHSAGAASLNVDFTFAHDRIHQAAYALPDSNRKNQVHLTIGRLLRHDSESRQQSEKLFEIAYHLNMGASLINDDQERMMLCAMNLEAGKQAKHANAYHPALNFFRQAIALLDENAWKTRYAFTLELYTEAAEAAYLCVDYESMDALIETGVAGTRNPLDRVGLYLVKISSCMARGELMDAINISKSVMASLSLRFPDKPNKLHVLAALIKIRWRLRNVAPEDWLDLPEMRDPNCLAILKIGSHIGGATMFAQPYLLPLLVLTGVTISLKHGHAPESMMTYAGMGMIYADVLKDVKKGYAYGKTALEIVDRLGLKSAKGRVLHVHNAMVRHWAEPVRNTLGPLNQAFSLFLEYGDFEYAAHAVAVRSFCAFESGLDLKSLFNDLKEAHDITVPLKQGPRLHYAKNVLQVIDNLMGNAEDPAILKGNYYDIDQMLELHEKTGDQALMVVDCKYQSYLCYLFGQYRKALYYADFARMRYEGPIQGMYIHIPYYFNDTLVRLANIRNAEGKTRLKLMFQISRNTLRFKQWAKTNPANTLNKLRLIQAECMMLRGKALEANDLYEESARLALEQGFIHEEALAYERCGLMHINSGRNTLGLTYLEKAKDFYLLWGAGAKVDDIYKKFPQLAFKEKINRKTASFGADLSAVDVGSLTKALKAIAEEDVHSSMVKKIIAMAMEFAGAQKGVLMLRDHEGVLHIEAEADMSGKEPKILQSAPVTEGDLAQGVINYVTRTHSGIVIHDALEQNEQIPGLETDPYIRGKNIRSLLCLPILTGDGQANELIGMLYLENNLSPGSFTQERFDTLEIICLCAAGRLELSRKAAIDGLTGLFNHDYFQNMLGQEFESARRHGHQLSLILMDIDLFKKFNDTWGHQAGDLVLKEVAQIIKECCRAGDVVARYGGEEMVVILPMTPLEDAAILAERLRSNVESHSVAYNNERLNVTISLGLASVDNAATDKDNLIHRADTALYQSKGKGRNCLTLA